MKSINTVHNTSQNMIITRGTVCFNHGKESGPWGSKITALAEVAKGNGFAVKSLDYQDLPDAPYKLVSHDSRAHLQNRSLTDDAPNRTPDPELSRHGCVAGLGSASG